MVFSYRPPKKRKDIKLFTQEISQQEKEEQEIFLSFLLVITTTDMESNLAKSYNYFFGIFLKVIQTHKKKARKGNKLAWIVK